MFRCDVFCNVIDNYGDIGVCWRLARQLSQRTAGLIRLWVNDLQSFARICPDVDPELAWQSVASIEICSWQGELQGVMPAPLVIEAFACRLPEAYEQAMAEQGCLWINLEYLSAEGWVRSCHLLPSPHPRWSINKYYFFPGFGAQTGGLLCELDLFAQRKQFDRLSYRQQLDPDQAIDSIWVSLFSYQNVSVSALLATWELSPRPVVCLVPEGKLMPDLFDYCGISQVGQRYQRGALTIHVLPFVPQPEYDWLLWACDLNFVRGEDSLVRAIWAGVPLVWHIYPQDDGVHMQKLKAFMACYTAELGELAAWQQLMLFWNGVDLEIEELAELWMEYVVQLEALKVGAARLALEWSRPDLISNLLNFCQKIGKIPSFDSRNS